MKKKKSNTSWQVTAVKIIQSFKDLKWLCITLIVFMAVFDWECGNKNGKIKFSVGCTPIKMGEIIGIIK